MPDANFLLTSGGTAVISAIFIQYLKNSSWIAFLGTEKIHEKYNLWFSIFIAIITSLGISYKFDSINGNLVISGLTSVSLMHHIGLAVNQWFQQHLAYKIAIVPTEMQGKILNQLTSINTSLEKK